MGSMVCSRLEPPVWAGIVSTQAGGVLVFGVGLSTRELRGGDSAESKRHDRPSFGWRAGLLADIVRSPPAYRLPAV